MRRQHDEYAAVPFVLYSKHTTLPGSLTDDTSSTILCCCMVRSFQRSDINKEGQHLGRRHRANICPSGTSIYPETMNLINPGFIPSTCTTNIHLPTTWSVLEQSSHQSSSLHLHHVAPHAHYRITVPISLVTIDTVDTSRSRLSFQNNMPDASKLSCFPPPRHA